MGPIPAKYFWPGFIVGLLLFSVGWGAATVWYAMSDGGAKIIQAKPLPKQPDSEQDQSSVEPNPATKRSEDRGD